MPQNLEIIDVPFPDLSHDRAFHGRNLLYCSYKLIAGIPQVFFFHFLVNLHQADVFLACSKQDMDDSGSFSKRDGKAADHAGIKGSSVSGFFYPENLFYVG